MSSKKEFTFLALNFISNNTCINPHLYFIYIDLHFYFIHKKKISILHISFSDKILYLYNKSITVTFMNCCNMTQANYIMHSKIRFIIIVFGLIMTGLINCVPVCYLLILVALFKENGRTWFRNTLSLSCKNTSRDCPFQFIYPSSHSWLCVYFTLSATLQFIFMSLLNVDTDMLCTVDTYMLCM